MLTRKFCVLDFCILVTLAPSLCAVAAVPAAAAAASPATLNTSAYQRATEQYAAVIAAHRRGGTCPKRGANVVDRQRELAASVAELSAGDGAKVLLYAVAANSVRGAQRLLAAGARRDSEDGSLLHVATRLGDAPMLDALVAAGFGIEDQGGATGTGTPLMAAVGAGRTENAEWLIKHGADVNATNPKGASVLLHSLLCNSQELVSLLIEAGAQPDAVSPKLPPNAPRNLVRNMAQQRGLDLHKKATLATRGRLGPPVGWHGPTPDELSGEPLRKNLATLYVEARADFDGDGKEDHAALFTADDGMKEGLFVKLSSRDPKEWMLAAETSHQQRSMGIGMAIAIAKPGKQVAACAKGYGSPCRADEPAEIMLKQAAIDYFRFESSGSIVYWEGATSGFKRVWTSD